MFRLNVSVKPDLHLKDVYYVEDFCGDKIARINKTCDSWWKVWYYREKYTVLRQSIKYALEEVERRYNRRSREILSRSSEEFSPLF